ATAVSCAVSLRDALPIYQQIGALVLGFVRFIATSVRPCQRNSRVHQNNARYHIRVLRSVNRGKHAAQRMPNDDIRSLNPGALQRSEEHTSELQSRENLVY